MDPDSVAETLKRKREGNPVQKKEGGAALNVLQNANEVRDYMANLLDGVNDESDTGSPSKTIRLNTLQQNKQCDGQGCSSDVPRVPKTAGTKEPTGTG